MTRTSTTGNWNNPPGYTLIELSVVLMLIGLMFFVSLPRLGDFLFRTDMKEAARSLKAAVHFLRSKSIVTQTPTVLHLDLDRRLYWGEFFEREEERQGKRKGRPPLVRPMGLPDGIRFLDASNINTPKMTSGVLSSSFNSKGALEEMVIHLTDRQSNIMTIIVNAFTGTFSIYDEYVEVEYGGSEK
jgi:prepilin-type N-terminal cleavage/methylation domain-containing protein